MTDYYAKQGDVNETLRMRLKNIVDLSAVDRVETRVWLPLQPATVLEAEVVDEDECIVDVLLGDETGWLCTEALPLEYRMETEAFFLDGSSKTVPNADPPDRLIVSARGRTE